MKVQEAATTEIFENLADEFTRALRHGENPSIDEVAEAHPLLADRIRLLFPMLALMEQGKPAGHELPQFDDRLPEHSLERLGDFRIEREIGRGGMGIVYEAVQESLGRQVALKLLPPSSLDERSSERFHQEARVAAKLHHTNIVPVYGVGRYEGYAYFVMQYIEGQGLDRVLLELEKLRSGVRPLPLDAPPPSDLSVSAANLFASGVVDEFGDTGTMRRDETHPTIQPRSAPGESGLHRTGYHYWINVARVGCQIASALAHAHSQKILHRDIKPSNLILDEAGSVWVTDFGLARLYENDRLTRTGEVVGTLRYMPPEQMSGQSDHRGDVYGLGLTLYEMLVLRPAFGETDHRRLIAQVSQCQPVAPRRLDPRIPRDLETIVLKCIDREPDKRYQSASDLERDLSRFMAGEPITARRISATERVVKWVRRHPAVAALATAATLFAVIGFAGIAWKWHEANTNLLESQKQSAAREIYFSKSLDAVDQMLTRVGSEMLANVPGMGEVRRQLLNDALVFYNELLQDSDDDPTLRREIGHILERAAYIHQRLGDQDKAAAAYARSAGTFADLRQEFPDDVINLLGYAAARSGHAQIMHQIGKNADAEIELREVIKLLDDQKSELIDPDSAHDHAAWLQVKAEAHSMLASVVQSTRGDDATMAQLEQSLALFDQIPDDFAEIDSVMEFHAKTLSALATKLERIDQIPRSIQLQDKAIGLFQALLETSPESPEFRNNMANLQQAKSGTLARQGQLAAASERLASEIADRRKLISDFPSIPDLRKDFARSLAIHGSVLNSIGKFAASRKLMEESIAIASQLTEQFPDVVNYQIELAFANQTMGTTTQLAGGTENLELSSAYHQKAYEVYQRIVEMAPRNPVYQYELGIAARNWSAAFLKLGKEADRGRELLDTAIDIFSRLSAAEPDNTDYLYQLAYTQINLANVLTTTQIAGAAEALEQACRWFTRLIAKQPGEPRFRLQLTRAYDQVSTLQYRLGEFSAWERSLRQANQVMNQVVEEFGRDARLVEFLTISQNHLGHCIKTRGQVDEAEQLFQAALEARQKFVEEDADNVKMSRKLASSHANLAWAMSFWREPEQRDLDQASRHATAATELDPGAAENWTCLAHVRYRQGDYPEVAKVLAKCQAVNDPDQMARLALQALVNWQLGDQQAARESLADCVNMRDSELLQNDFHARLVQPEYFQLVNQAAALISQ